VFTPVAGTEYPSSPVVGDSWFIGGLASPYLYVSGDLAGKSTDNQDKIYYTATGWSLIESADIPSDIVKYVGLISDLATVDKNIYTTVVVQEAGRGGTFNYDASQSAVNDGGVVFDGWVREYSGSLNYKWYGLLVFEFFVSTIGNDSNDGFSAGTPFLTLQKAIDTYATFRRDIGEECTIHVADGTYSEGAVIDGIFSDSEIVISGASKLGTIIDGSSSSEHGLNFNNLCGGSRVKNITVQNFRADGKSGILFQNKTTGVVDTALIHNNYEANINCSGESILYVIGLSKISGDAKFGIRFYSHSRGSLGDGINNYEIRDANTAGVVIRDNSRCVCNDGLTVEDCNTFHFTAGVYIYKHSYCELRTTSIINCARAISAETLGVFDSQQGTITLTGNTIDKVFVDGSIDRTLYNSNNLIPYLFKPLSNPSGDLPSSNYHVVVDHNGATGLQFLTNGNDAKIDFDKDSRISYVASDGSIRFNSKSKEIRFNESAYYPTGTLSLGANGFGWDKVYANTYYVGSKAGLTRDIVTSGGTLKFEGGILVDVV